MGVKNSYIGPTGDCSRLLALAFESCRCDGDHDNGREMGEGSFDTRGRGSSRRNSSQGGDQWRRDALTHLRPGYIGNGC